jgi:hypothetical protein
LLRRYLLTFLEAEGVFAAFYTRTSLLTKQSILAPFLRSQHHDDHDQVYRRSHYPLPRHDRHQR